ncbi:Glycogen synthase [Glycine soja]|nr:Glycogen synthase [Glycine soja]
MGTLFFFHSPIPRFSLPSMPKPIALPPLSCLRNNGDVNKIVDMPQSMYDDNQNVKQDNIWQLSKEAQQNILYLNKQHLGAIKELDKTNKEKQSLLSKIKKLEAEKQAGADNLSTCSELLLRIDTMVLSSMISAGEASELRSLVMNYKVSPPDVFNIISHKKDPELLGELRRFSDGHKKGKLVIAPYGLDKSTWDPLTDYFLPENFNAENMNGKAVCKAALLQQLGLSEHSSAILVGCIFSEGRDLDEKRVKEVILNAKQHDVQFIFMGASKRSVLNQAPESLQKEFKDDNLKFVPTYDEALLHLVFAGSDIILCQSFLDPTDEIPLIALRYGAAPLALVPDASSNRSIPFDRSFINQDHEATKYSKLINSSFVNMFISLAIDEIRTNPAMWKRKIMQAMAHDLSWDGECYDVHVEAYSTIKNM